MTHTKKIDRPKAVSCLAATLSLAATLGLAGCGMSTSSVTTKSTTVPGAYKAMRGKVHGGQQPIAGATIQLYAVGTTGLASASTALLTTPVSTASDGTFTFTGAYTCPQGALTYIVATGGNPGLSGGGNNTAIALMAVTGSCNTANTDSSGRTFYTLDPTGFFSINELTTMASVYALAPFMTDFAHLGANNQSGLIHAFTTATQLADMHAGVAPGTALPASVTYDPSTGFTVVLQTLADILSVCVNSTGQDGTCSSLFGLTGSPTDTIGAALAIVRNPGRNVLSLWNMTPPQPPFQPTLTAAPSDWTITLKYTGLPLTSPSGLGFDSQGNLWITNSGSGSVSKIYSGADGMHAAGTSAQYTGGGLLGANGLAIDFSDNVWVANTLGSSIVEFDAQGNVLSGPSGYKAGGINAPVALAIDGQNSVWVANYNGNSVTQLLNNGTASGFSPLTTGGLNIAVSRPTGISTDLYSNVYVSNSGFDITSYGLRGLLLRFDLNGNPQSCLSSNMAQPIGMAVDTLGNYVIASNGLSGVTIGGNTCTATNGTAYTAGLYTGGGISQPSAVALDGAGTVWVANATAAGSLSALSAVDGSALSPTNGYSALNLPRGLAVDNAGSVWTANAGDNSVNEFIGIAAPRVTPIAAAVYQPLAGN